MTAVPTLYRYKVLPTHKGGTGAVPLVLVGFTDKSAGIRSQERLKYAEAVDSRAKTFEDPWRLQPTKGIHARQGPAPNHGPSALTE